jgi:PhzF family phenazine biosynthesis protein
MRQWTIDAFTSRPFGGNPACIVEPLSEWPDTAWMQALARENNAGATAFIVRGDVPHRFSLKWFTASVEVPLCGHATLAAAHALFNETDLTGEAIAFETASGPLSVRQTSDGLEMDFPAQAATRIPPPPALTKALGVCPLEVWAGPYLVAILDTPAAVSAAAPDLELVRAISLELEGQGNVGVAACVPGTASFDVIDRFFAPGYGIDEDAATGSFHCILAPIMAETLGRSRLRFHQASPGRGADLTCSVAGDRVLLSGKAVTIAESVLRVAPHRGQ